MNINLVFPKIGDPNTQNTVPRIFGNSERWIRFGSLRPIAAHALTELSVSRRRNFGARDSERGKERNTAAVYRWIRAWLRVHGSGV